MGEGVRLTKLLLLLLLLLAPEGGQGRKMRGGRGREEARGGIQGGLAELLGGLLPNTYYSRPNYRYPYYDKTGKVILSPFDILDLFSSKLSLRTGLI